jgi:hypothetical protein
MMVRTRRSVWVAGCILAVVFGAPGCDEKLSDLTGPTPNLQATFSSIRTEIFETTDLAGRTACVSCHTNQGRFPAGNLNLRSDPYAALVGVASAGRPGLKRVEPGDPDASYLIHKLEGRSGIAGVRMPLNGPPFLTNGQMVVIRRWIELGAPNN